jgi:hypothetical protein
MHRWLMALTICATLLRAAVLFLGITRILPTFRRETGVMRPYCGFSAMLTSTR